MIHLSHAEPASAYTPAPIAAAWGAVERGPTIRGRLKTIARGHGFSGAAYMHLGRTQAAEPRRLVAVGGFNEEAYRRGGLLASDPLAQRAAKAFLPFVWSLDDMDAGSAPFARALRGWGAHAGVIAPVQDYATGPAFLNLFGAVAETLLIEPGALMLDASRLHADLRAHAVADADAASDLAAREIEVLRLAAQGCTEVETAETLNLSRRGVQFHLARAMAKLGAPNKTAAVARAIASGLIAV